MPCSSSSKSGRVSFSSFNHSYYMASSASDQDDPNRALWLATRAGKMEPSCPPGTTRCIPQAKFPRKPYNKSFIDQVCSVLMAGYWPCSFFASLWYLTNIQPSWHHTWSLNHIYWLKFRPRSLNPNVLARLKLSGLRSTYFPLFGFLEDGNGRFCSDITKKKHSTATKANLRWTRPRTAFVHIYFVQMKYRTAIGNFRNTFSLFLSARLLILSYEKEISLYTNLTNFS